jgi:hypothetical protein
MVSVFYCDHKFIKNEVEGREKSLMQRGHWEELGTDAKILKRILKKEECLGVEWIHLAQNMAQVRALKQQR